MTAPVQVAAPIAAVCAIAAGLLHGVDAALFVAAPWAIAAVAARRSEWELIDQRNNTTKHLNPRRPT